jgi:hypothetical protein
MLQDGIELLGLEESFARIVFAEHSESRRHSNFFAGKPERSLEGGKLAIDRRVRRLLLLTKHDVRVQSIFSDVDRTRICKESPKILCPTSSASGALAAVRL